MSENARHVPLRPLPWSEKDAIAAIEEIVADALLHFNVERFWPAHPLDDGSRDGHTSLYYGASGVIWGIDHLSRTGATRTHFDFRPILPRLMEANRAELPNYNDYAAHGSLLFGDLGAALVVMRLAPAPAIADLVHARADANSTLPMRELMWGTAGSMLAFSLRADGGNDGRGALANAFRVSGHASPRRVGRDARGFVVDARSI